MTSSERRKPNYRRRFGWLGAFIVVLFGGYSAGWFYLADFVETRAQGALQSFSANGREADCFNLSAQGFPFRIGVWCDKVIYEDPRLTVEAEHFRSAAQVYDPFHVVAELDSPATLDLPVIGIVRADWDNLRASVRADYDFPQHADFELRNLEAELVDRGWVKVQAGEAHMRRNGENLDVAMTFTGASADKQVLQGAEMPPLAGAVDLTLNDGVRIALKGGGSPRGWSGEIRNLSLSSGPDTALSISGPISIDDQGLVDASLMLSLQNPGKMSAVLQAIFPKAGDLSSLAMLGNSKIPLTIKAGQAQLLGGLLKFAVPRL